MAGCGADNLANEIAESLAGDLNFDITIPDFSGPEYEFPSDTGGERLPVTPITTADLTTQHVGGSGVFDALMSAFKSHLDQEYEKSRITGKDYAEAYVALTNGAMGNATQFLLGKDQAYWSAVGAQIAARTAEVQLVTSRVQLAAEKTKLQMLKFDAMNAQANFLLTKMRLASESMAYCISKYNLEEMMPLQKTALINENNLSVQRLATLKVETANTGKQGQLLDAEILLAPKKADQLDKQIANVGAQTSLTNKQVELADAEVKLAPKKATMLDKQIAGAEAQTSLTTKQVALAQSELDLAPKKSVMLDKQIANQEAQTTQTAAQTEQVKAQTSYVGKQGTFIDKQIEQITEELKLQPYKKTLMQEQAEAARAQTADTRSDGTPIAGSLGKQKDLYNQQILSYQRDAEMKAAKVFIDAWITMKTIDEGLAPPNGFANSNLDQILTSLRTKNGI